MHYTEKFDPKFNSDIFWRHGHVLASPTRTTPFCSRNPIIDHSDNTSASQLAYQFLERPYDCVLGTDGACGSLARAVTPPVILELCASRENNKCARGPSTCLKWARRHALVGFAEFASPFSNTGGRGGVVGLTQCTRPFRMNRALPENDLRTEWREPVILPAPKHPQPSEYVQALIQGRVRVLEWRYALPRRVRPSCPVICRINDRITCAI